MPSGSSFVGGFLKSAIPPAETFSITWQVESVGMRRLTLIQDDIKGLAAEFSGAYLSENADALKSLS